MQFLLRNALCAISVAASLGAAEDAAAQAYPNRPIRAIIGFAPGGATDLLTRGIGQELGEALGQSVVIDNRPGAGGNIGTEMVTRAAPDGYTLLATTSGPIVIGPSLYPKLSYDVMKDLSPITLAAVYYYLIGVHPSVAARDMKDLLQLARNQPGKLTAASTGVGTPVHLGIELLKMTANVDIAQVQYKGAGPALLDVLGGHVQIVMSSLPSQIPHVRTGKLRALAVTSGKRLSVLPEVPSVSESALPGFVVDSWFGFLAPSGTSPAIIDRIQKETRRIVHSGNARAQLAREGSEPVGSTPAEFAKVIREDHAKWAKVIRNAGIKPE